MTNQNTRPPLPFKDFFKDSLSQYIIYFLKQHPKFRAWLIAGVVIILATALACKIFFPDFFIKIKEFSNDALTITAILCALSLAYSIISYAEQDYTEHFSHDLERIREERKNLQSQIESDKDEIPAIKDIFYTVQLNINRLDEYYTINIRQSYRSFNMSVTLIILGFLTMITGLWIFYFDNNRNITMAITSGISSIIMEFIGGTCFYIYNKTAKQLNTFYDRLVVAQDTMLAIKLCDQIEPQERQHDVRLQIILSLLDRCKNI